MMISTEKRVLLCETCRCPAVQEQFVALETDGRQDRYGAGTMAQITNTPDGLAALFVVYGSTSAIV